MTPAARLLLALAHDPSPPPFALLCRHEAERGGHDPAAEPILDLLIGEPDDVHDVARLADLPLPAPGMPPVFAMVPFRQVAELGYAHHDDGAPLRYLQVRECHELTRTEALEVLPTDDIPLTATGFDLDDDAYTEVVKRVIADEIGRGEGANFVIRRELRAVQPVPPVRAALAVLGRLLRGERGAYWTFAVQLGDLTAVGATPERHLSAASGRVVMNPISGTFRYPPGGPTRDQLLAFLADRKEVEELFMVVDEELKMMSRLAVAGGQVHGPLLKPMAHLAHTEYLLTGFSDADVREVLRESMFAATVTGSPVQNACQVIARHEGGGRGYYSGMAALISAGPDGPQLDAPILIRTAYLGDDGSVRVPVGATLVRHSVPEHEVAETHAKAAGVLAAFTANASEAAEASRRALPADLTDDPQVAAALASRNATLAPFWLQQQADRPDARLCGRRALVIDAEDAWTAMLAHMLRRLGMVAHIEQWDAVSPAQIARADLLVAGPGPGDPRDLGDRRIAALHGVIATRLAGRRPLLAVCLSHQILAGLLGLVIAPLAQPYQGTQRRVAAFGRDVRVGFYNTFTARAPRGAAPSGVEVWTAGLTEDDDEIVALRGDRWASVQFHLESVLSPDGVDLLADLAAALLVSGTGP